jgi:hypothetical protein
MGLDDTNIHYSLSQNWGSVPGFSISGYRFDDLKLAISSSAEKKYEITSTVLGLVWIHELNLS